MGKVTFFPLMGNVTELRQRAFLFEVKPEGLTEYRPGIRI